MRSIISVLFLLLFSHTLAAQPFFEGEVIYKSEVFKKINGKVVRDTTLPVSFIKATFKNGNWLQQPDAGAVEYMYFDVASNKVYWKLRHSDTLFFEDGRYRRTVEDDVAMHYHIRCNTDTLLGKVCNSLVIQTKAVRLTFVYNKDLLINPTWYAHSKIGFYDLIYTKTRCVWLKSVVETKQSVSVSTATEIYDTDVADGTFPAIWKNPLLKLR